MTARATNRDPPPPLPRVSGLLRRTRRHGSDTDRNSISRTFNEFSYLVATKRCPQEAAAYRRCGIRVPFLGTRAIGQWLSCADLDGYLGLTWADRYLGPSCHAPDRIMAAAAIATSATTNQAISIRPLAVSTRTFSHLPFASLIRHRLCVARSTCRWP